MKKLLAIILSLVMILSPPRVFALDAENNGESTDEEFAWAVAPEPSGTEGPESPFPNGEDPGGAAIPMEDETGIDGGIGAVEFSTVSTVYVGDGGDDNNSGTSAGEAVATIGAAYAKLPAGGGTIVVCGDLTIPGEQSIEYGDEVTITGSDGQGQTGGRIVFYNKGNLFYAFGRRTVLKDLTLSGNSTSTILLASKNSLTISENVITDADRVFAIYGGCRDDYSTENIEVSVYGGTFKLFQASRPGQVGNVTMNVGGNAVVKTTLLGGAANVVGGAALHVTGGDAGTIQIGQKLVQKASIDLQTGSAAGIVPNTGGPVYDVTVTISPEFHLTGSYGPDRGASVIHGTRTLNLPGWTEVPSGMFDNYEVINLTDHSAIQYGGSLSGKILNVAAGCSVSLGRYANAAAAAADGATISGEGTVTYTGVDLTGETLKVVYLDESALSAGSGKTPESPVQALTTAYSLLDPEKGGTIVVCGSLSLNGTLVHSMTDHSCVGPVTITGRYGGVDYNPTVTVQNTSKISYLMFGPRTTLEHLSFREAGAEKVSIYSNYSLTLGEGFSCDAAEKKIYSVYAGCPGRNYANDDIYLTLLGGNYSEVFMGQNHGPVGVVHYTQGGTATVLSNVTLGNGSAEETVGGIDFTMNGGYTKVIYDTPRATGHAGNVTMHLNGGSIVEFRDYTNLTGGASMGDITVYLSPEFSFTGSIGVWLNKDLAAGKKALVLTGYTGTDLPKGVDNYDTVNFVGSSSTPQGMEVNPSIEAGKRLLQIADYRSSLSVGLESFDQLRISHNSDILYLDTYPAGLPLDVAEGSTLRLSASANSAVPTHTGRGTVIVEAPQYSNPTRVLSVNFDGGNAADASGNGNDGVITGKAEYTASFDGSKALYLGNTFGVSAQNYVTFPDLKGLDLTRDSYTVSFWVRTENGGADRWYGSGDGVKAGSGLVMSKNRIGGVLFSNADSKDGTASGFSAAQLHKDQYLTLAMTSAQGGQRATDGARETADSNWYFVTVAVDRDGAYKLYINDTLKTSVQIADMKGQTLGINTLGLGADALGQYGIGCAWFDDLTIYSRALDIVDVQANYALGALKGTLYEIETRLASAGKEYSAEALADMRAALQRGRTAAAAITTDNYAQAIALEAELRAALEAFLMSPAKNANMSMMLISDIHISNTSDARAVNLRQLFRDQEAAGIPMDGIIQSGDFGNDSSVGTSTAAFDVMEECLRKNTDWQMIGCMGNHETQYTNESANYMAAAQVYWDRMQAHISDDNSVRQYGGAVVDSVFQHTEVNQGKEFSGAPCFGLTFKGYHYVVINSDNPGQFADLSKLTNPTVEEALAADPIRHGTWFSEETLEWLDKQMAEYAEDGLPIFVVCHFPFVDTVPLSSFDPIPINDNSIGRPDREVRNILAKYDQVIYFCGHLHNNMGVNNIVTVTAENGGTFTEINLPTLNTSVRGYAAIPATWYMYVYDTEIVLRGRDALNGKWLTGYDIVIPLEEQPIDPPVDPGPEVPDVPPVPSVPEQPAVPVFPAPAPSGSSSNVGHLSTNPDEPAGQPDAEPSDEAVVNVPAQVEGSSAAASISTAAADALAAQAVAAGSTDMIVVVEAPDNVTRMNVYLSSDAVSELSKPEADLVIRTPVADIAVGSRTLTAFAEADSGIMVSVERMENTIEFSMTMSGQKLDVIPGGVVLTAPCADCGPGTVAVLVHEDGRREVIRKSIANSNSGTISIPLSGSARVELSDNAKTFRDVPAEGPVADAVAFVSAHQLFNGTSETTFSPKQSMTRGMLAMVLHNLENNPDPAAEMPFADVGSRAWYAKAVTWAASTGVVNGYANGSFGAEDAVTREQLLVMLYRYAGSPRVSTITLAFSDADAASAYAVQALRWAVENGILDNSPGDMLRPKEAASREDVAQMMWAFMRA